MSEKLRPKGELQGGAPEGCFEQLPDMTLTTRLILGECQLEIAEILKLGQGSVLELNTLAEGPLQLWVNDQLIAKVRPVLSEDKVGAQIIEIASREERIKEFVLSPSE